MSRVKYLSDTEVSGGVDMSAVRHIPRNRFVVDEFNSPVGEQEPVDRLLVHFTGHGIERLPSAGQTQEPEAYSPHQVVIRVISASEVDQFDRADCLWAADPNWPPQHQVIFLNACHSGNVPWGFAALSPVKPIECFGATYHDSDVGREAHAGLDNLLQLKPDWNGCGSMPPNDQAVQHARLVLHALRQLGLAPDRLVPSAEEGVGIYIENKSRYAIVECFNDGDIVIGTSDRQGDVRSWDVHPNIGSIRQAIDKMLMFLNG